MTTTDLPQATTTTEIATRPLRLVVVGNGMAGARAVEEILSRNGGDLFDITVFGDEPYGNYNRIMLSGLLSGEHEERDIILNDVDWYTERGIRLHTGTRIGHIDRENRQVHSQDGARFPYDVLIIATGSRSFMPPIGGLHLADGTLREGVFGFRTVDDTRDMMRTAREHRRAVVIGGGLLGLEAARGLLAHGLAVDLLHATEWLMNQQLDEAAGTLLRQQIEELGISVHCSAITEQILGDARVEGVRLADGTVIACDMVVVAAGIRSNNELATASGLTVDRAIVVDDQMRTVDDENIYAVGECAQHRGQVYGLVAPLWEQARVLAAHLTGARTGTTYEGSRTATKLKVAGVDVATMGVKSPEHEDDEHVVFSEPRRGVHKSVVIRGDRLIGATLVGDVSKAANLVQAFDRGLPLPEDRAQLLFDIGPGSAEPSAEDLDDDAQVCNCNGVSKGTLVKTVQDGARSVPAVMDRTRAGKGCGSCKSLVKQIVDWAAGGESEEDASASWYVPGIPLSKPDLVAAVKERGLKSVSSVFAALAPDAAEDAKSKMGLASLLHMIWNSEYVDERDARFINDRVHANVQRDGTFSVVPQMKGGCTTPEQLRRIADVAEKYQVPLVKVTGGQRIDLLGVRKEQLPDVWSDLDMPSGFAYGKNFRTVKTCVGAEFCRFGLGDSTNLGVAIESRFQGLESPAKLKLAVAGCPRNCSEAYVKDVGVVAVDGGRWEIYVGGAAGAQVRKGDLLATVDSPERVLLLIGRFLQYYREQANWLERTYAFLPRVGIEEIRAIVVEDRDGIAERLDAAIEESVAAYRDPWAERDEPATPGQFTTSLPLIALPQVPVR